MENYNDEVAIVFFTLSEKKIVRKFILCGSVVLDAKHHVWRVLTEEGVMCISALKWMTEAVMATPIWGMYVLDTPDEKLPSPFTLEDFVSTEEDDLSE